MEIRELFKKWQDGASTGEEEQALRSYFLSTRDIPAEFAPYKLMFEGFASISRDKEPKDVRVVFQKRWHAGWIMAAAAAIAVAIAFAATLRTPYCSVNGSPVFDKKIAQAVTADLNNLSQIDDALDQLSLILR